MVVVVVVVVVLCKTRGLKVATTTATLSILVSYCHLVYGIFFCELFPLTRY